MYKIQHRPVCLKLLAAAGILLLISCSPEPISTQGAATEPTLSADLIIENYDYYEAGTRATVRNVQHILKQYNVADKILNHVDLESAVIEFLYMLLKTCLIDLQKLYRMHRHVGVTQVF